MDELTTDELWLLIANATKKINYQAEMAKDPIPVSRTSLDDSIVYAEKVLEYLNELIGHYK